MQTAPAPPMSRSLLAFSIFYGGMTCIAGVLGNKQVALGPLAVEAGIFAFLLLVVTSSAVAELHGRTFANQLVLLGFIPLLEGATIFRIIDFFVVNNLILISAFTLCIFIGWVVSESALRDELDITDQRWFPIWRFVMRYIAPSAIALISVMTIIDQAS